MVIPGAGRTELCVCERACAGFGNSGEFLVPRGCRETFQPRDGDLEWDPRQGWLQEGQACPSARLGPSPLGKRHLKDLGTELRRGQSWAELPGKLRCFLQLGTARPGRQPCPCYPQLARMCLESPKGHFGEHSWLPGVTTEGADTAEPHSPPQGHEGPDPI